MGASLGTLGSEWGIVHWSLLEVAETELKDLSVAVGAFWGPFHPTSTP